jgi:hypothetical protein
MTRSGESCRQEHPPGCRHALHDGHRTIPAMQLLPVYAPVPPMPPAILHVPSRACSQGMVGDYCRYVARNNQTYWSCALAGSNNSVPEEQYTEPGQYTEEVTTRPTSCRGFRECRLPREGAVHAWREAGMCEP